MKYTCLVFGEGGKDKKFLMALIDLPKFRYHTKKWFFSYDNASGSSPKIILKQCRRSALGKSYDLILCFIDLDKLKSDHPNKWQVEKKKLEQDYSAFVIIWQIDNAEDEYKTVLGDKYYGKHRLNKMAKEKINKFINSNFWQKILKPIKDTERKMEEKESPGADHSLNEI